MKTNDLAECRCTHCTCRTPQQEALRDEAIERSRTVLWEYRIDLRSGKWSDALLAAMDNLRAALAAERKGRAGG